MFPVEYSALNKIEKSTVGDVDTALSYEEAPPSSSLLSSWVSWEEEWMIKWAEEMAQGVRGRVLTVEPGSS